MNRGQKSSWIGKPPSGSSEKSCSEDLHPAFGIGRFAAGFPFYERQEAGLGTYFLDSLYSDIDSLRLYAGIHPVHFKKFRLLSKRFPFAVYYEVKENTAFVRAVLDLRRNPAWIAEKLNKRK